jgi:hypothetical protein
MKVFDKGGYAARQARIGGKIAEFGLNETGVFVVFNNRGWAMKTLKISLIASLIGTAVGLGSSVQVHSSLLNVVLHD